VAHQEAWWEGVHVTENEARVILCNQLINNWDTDVGLPAVPYYLDNEAQKPEGLVEYILMRVIHFPGPQQHTLGGTGNRKFRRRGRVQIQVRTDVDIGLQRLDFLGRTARLLFEAKTISGVMLHDGTFVEQGRVGEHYGGEVSVEFSYDEIK